MKYPEYYTRFEKFGLWLGARSTLTMSVLFGLFLFCLELILLTAIGAVPHGHESFSSALLSSATSSLFTAIIGATVFGLVIPRARDRFDKVFGFELTNRERVDLSAWLRSGIKPESERLQPKLRVYLDYLTPIATGQNLFRTRNRVYQAILFLFYALGCVFFTVSVIIVPEIRGHFYVYINIALFGFFAYALNPFQKGPKALYVRMNRRRIAQIARRERELH